MNSQRRKLQHVWWRLWWAHGRFERPGLFLWIGYRGYRVMPWRRSVGTKSHHVKGMFTGTGRTRA